MRSGIEMMREKAGMVESGMDRIRSLQWTPICASFKGKGEKTVLRKGKIGEMKERKVRKELGPWYSSGRDLRGSVNKNMFASPVGISR
jgi:hypothetical protein